MSSASFNQNVYVNVVLRSTFCLLSTVGNGLVICIILKNKNAIRDGFNVLLLQLALGDFFIGFGNGVRVLESLLSHYKLLSVTPINCFLVELPLLLGSNLSQLIMFLIAVDRFISIQKLHGFLLINNKNFIWTRAFFCVFFAVFASLAALIGISSDAPEGIAACHVTLGWSQSYMVYYSIMTTFFSITILGDTSVRS
ncbi:hypothetical protein L596_015911 [Steinernema carpocapsae]|uniref:G-protein coupled receptors family 1 profile domain-containing protein n=1 Tax=Steinernema carpocapsae TaxID=34508 RepID=A0A4U5NHC6_STECR|nr:hypothetical protein L596_015911 [Steinernema carpocapsae]